MIRTLRGLDVKEKRQLIKLLAPGLDLDEAHEEHVTAMLKVALRTVLEVPPGDDLPEVMRRRLVEVAVTRFELARKVDLVADDELAKEIIGFLLIAAHRMANDDALRAEFVTFLRTKDRPQRTRWLHQSLRFEEILGGVSDARVVSRLPDEVELVPTPHDITAITMLAALSLVREINPGAPTHELASPDLLAGVPGAVLAPGLSAVAGGLYMAGRRSHDLTRPPDEDDSKQARAKRARRSKLVQNVVTICAFVVVQPRRGRARD